MKRYAIYILLFALGLNVVYATDHLRFPDTRTLGMGGNGVVHSPLLNPSLLALLSEMEVRSDYFNRYSLKELASVGAGFCFPNPMLPAGVHIASFGYDEYRESMFRLSAAKRLSKYWTLGVSLQYSLWQSALFESDISRISTDIGLTWQPYQNWLIALTAVNTPSVSVSNENDDRRYVTPYMYAIGLRWDMRNDLSITAGIRHTEETPAACSAGMEYMPFDDFRLRTGFSSSPLQPSLGVGYCFSGLTADLALIYHPVLGVSSGIGLSYSF
ncbi:MAG: TonB-dependent receptor [Tannerella sp.]|nr:TonB-dependent receptor [Tannerella sp.]